MVSWKGAALMKSALPMMVTVGIVSWGLGFDASATLINGSFESSSFSGWQLQVSNGRSASQRASRPAGTASVVSAWGQPGGQYPFRSARDGNRFAMLATLANGNFTGHQDCQISLQQELSLTAGTMLSGWASFFNGDTDAQDSAWVKILDADGSSIATPWLETSGRGSEHDFNHVGYREASPWTQWSWQTPATGAYTLSFGMTTADDNNFASYGFFDDLLVSPAALPVPEPSALALMTLGAGLFLRQRGATSRHQQD